MTKLDVLLAQAAALQKAIEAELEKQNQFGSDEDYENGTVLLWKRTFSTGAKQYTYVALKCGKDRWYLTGMQQGSITFDQLVDVHLRYAVMNSIDHIWRATEWEAVVEV